MKRYLRNILIGLDQFVGTVIPGSYPDETISARCWRQRDRFVWGLLRQIVDILFFWDRDHCETSYASETARTQAPPETRL